MVPAREHLRCSLALTAYVSGSHTSTSAESPARPRRPPGEKWTTAPCDCWKIPISMVRTWLLYVSALGSRALVSCFAWPVSFRTALVSRCDGADARGGVGRPA
jgi:hypothetical protein